jgi:hypothetical protein
MFVFMKVRKSSAVEETTLVRVEKKIKLKVQKYLVGKKESVGEYFSIAAEEKLKRESK